jgi:competence protein ComEC
MNRKRSTLLICALAAAILGVACLLSSPPKKDNRAHVYMLNVGQGDSFLIQTANGRQILVDGGRDASALSELARVMPRGDRTIDLVIATHPDADHIGGLPLILSRYKVGAVLTTEAASETATYRSLMQMLHEKQIPAYYARHGMSIALDATLPTILSILFPDRSTGGWETNTASVIARLDAGNASALFTGDSPQSVETFLARSVPEKIDTDVLKLGHHGSKTSSGEAFLKAVSPTLALISAGVDNRYGHPHNEVTERLHALGIPWISTQQSGTVDISTDGTGWDF